MAKKTTPQTAVFQWQKPDWYPPGLEKCVPHWLPDPWNCWMTGANVTSAMAAEWLKLNVANNRGIIPTLVEQVFYDLTADKFYATHQGVAFNVENKMFDGQNRLTAIVEAADHPAPLLVFWGVDDGTMGVVDTGRSRTIKASAQIAGHSFGSRHIAIMNRALQHLSYSRQRMSRSRLFELIEEHREGLDWSVKLFTSMPYNRADIGAAFFRAFYHIDPVILERVAKVLKSGMADYETDSVLMILRDRIMMGARNSSATGLAMTPSQRDMDRYFKVLRAITAVVRGEKLDKLQTPLQMEYYQEIYPLPESVAKWTSASKPRDGRRVYWPQKVGSQSVG